MTRERLGTFSFFFLSLLSWESGLSMLSIICRDKGLAQFMAPSSVLYPAKPHLRLRLYGILIMWKRGVRWVVYFEDSRSRHSFITAFLRSSVSFKLAKALHDLSIKFLDAGDDADATCVIFICSLEAEAGYTSDNENHYPNLLTIFRNWNDPLIHDLKVSRLWMQTEALPMH